MIALLPVVGVVFGGLVTYLVARRKTSGKIDTTEAETLWEESSRMRNELRAEIVGLRKRIVTIEQRCAKEIGLLEARVIELERRIRG